MARRNTGYQSTRSPHQINLERIRDTSDTIRSTTREEVSANYTQSESVPPPFMGGQTDTPYITRSELGLTWKIAAIIGGLFLTVGVPLIWYAATLGNNVDNLQQDVKEVKDKTQILIESNIKQDIKLNSVELSVTNVKAQVDSQMQKGSDSRASNKQMQPTR